MDGLATVLATTQGFRVKRSASARITDFKAEAAAAKLITLRIKRG